MELTRQADYAVRIVLDLAEQPRARPVRSSDIARRQLIPRPFLTKIVQVLGKRGYLRTHRGATGGVSLARDPAGITLREVIEAIEGPIRLNRCAAGGYVCPLERRCPVHPVWRRLQEMVLRELEKTSFESLLKRKTA